MFLTVKKIQPETINAVSLIFEKPPKFTYYPGQYVDLELPKIIDDGLGKVRAFSFSSSPTEKNLIITFKKGYSTFKKALQSVKINQQIKISHPAGTFILDETESAVFLAGGIGVTPFRSMIKSATDSKLTTPITLIYSNANPNFIFKKELELWARLNNNIKIIYLNTKTVGHLKPQLIPQTKNGIYYLAGSSGMIKDFYALLTGMQIDPVNIRTDSFDGY